MSTILFWAMLMLAVVVFSALLALLAVRLRRDWRVLRGEGVTVEAQVAGFEHDPDGSRFPVYAWTGPDGASHIVRGTAGKLFAPALGQTRRLVYLPGAESEAEPSGWRGPLGIDALVLALTVAAGLVVARMMGW